MRALPTRRPAVLAVAAVAALTLLAACGSDPKPAAGTEDPSSGSSDAGGGTTIVFSPPGLQIPAMQGLQQGLEAAAGQAGYQVIAQDPALDATKQATDLQAVIDSGKADAAWLIAVAPESLTALVQSAQAKGVPMVLNGVPEDYGLSGPQAGLTFDTVDYRAYGDALGTALGECITDKLDGKGQVIFEESAPGTAGKGDMEAAAKAALAKTAPDAEIVTSVVTNDRAKAQTDIGNALQGNPGANAVLGNTDEGALGAIGAFKAAGKDLPCVATAGGSEETMVAVKSGEIYAVVALQFDADMKQTFDALVKMLADPSAEGLQLTVPQEVVKADS